MNGIFQALVVMGFLIFSNVVGAGVVLVLGRTLQQIAPGLDSPWPWFVICGAAAIAAFLFLRGAMCYANRLPLIQWRAGQRGG